MSQIKADLYPISILGGLLSDGAIGPATDLYLVCGARKTRHSTGITEGKPSASLVRAYSAEEAEERFADWIREGNDTVDTVIYDCQHVGKFPTLAGLVDLPLPTINVGAEAQAASRLARQWTVSDMEVLLHHHVSPDPHPRRDAPAVQESIRMWCEQGCLTTRAGTYTTAQVTDKGLALITLWKSCPVPTEETVWRDQFGNIIDVR